MSVATDVSAGSTRATARTAQPPLRPQRRWSWAKATPYLLIAPAVVLELLVHLVPMLVGIWMSFIQLTQFFIRNWTAAPGAGLANYKLAVDTTGPIGKDLLQSFAVTCLYTVIVVGVSTAVGLAGAFVLQRSFRGRGLFRTLFLVPYALPVYAGVIIWSFMLQRDNGLINHVLMSNLHLIDKPAFWLIGNNAFISTAIVAIWRTWPFAFLMFMAGMQSIPDEVYDASAVDGASVWGQLRHVTMGMLRPVTTVLLLMTFLWTFNDFNTPFVLFGPTAPKSADLVSIHIYSNSFVNWNFGLGSAMSVLLLVFLLLVTVVFLGIRNRRASRV